MAEEHSDEDDDELRMMKKCREHIHRNFSSLIELTRLDPLTMAKIKERDILGTGDMEAVACKINRHDKNSEFYGRIVSRLGFHKVLLEVMEATKQTEVLRILNKFDAAEVAQLKKYRKVPQSLQEFLDNKSSKFCILQTMDNQIICEKLKENLKRCRITDEKKFLEMISSVSSLRQDVVHVVNDSTTKNMRHIMVTMMGDKSVAKLVLITSEAVEKLEEFVGRNPSWGRSVELRRDSMEWGDMTLAKQCEMRAKLEDFFGTEFEEEADLVRLRGQLLVDLINEKDLNELQLFKETLPKELRYYVGRKVLSRNFISMNIFELGSSDADVLLFSGTMKRNELSRFAKGQRTDSSRIQIHQEELSVRFMILDHPNHFDKICSKTDKNVHWLRYEGGRLRWIRSNGNLNEVQNCVEKVQLAEGEEEFCLNLKSSLPVCISDSPGMGKSVLLAQIGRRLAREHPARLVLFIVLGEFIQKVKAKLGTLETLAEAVKSALEETVSGNVIGEIVLKSRLGESPKSEEAILVELLLDGFDEVDTTDLKLAFEVMQTIKSSWKTSRLWVTSRPHLMEQLEQNLGQLGFTIQPFCEADQVQFLTSFWSQDGTLDPGRTLEFAKACLGSLKGKMNFENGDIAGIPLQCLLIGEVFKGEAEEYSYSDNDNDPAMTLHIDMSTITIRQFTITNLYERLVKVKFEKYTRVYGGVKLTFDAAMDMLVRLSLELIFPDHFEQLKHSFQETGTVLELLKIGIVEECASAGKPRFIHRTFAEYFVAWFVIQRLKQVDDDDDDKRWREPLPNIFWKGIMRCEKLKGEKGPAFLYPVTCYFFNSLLGNCLKSLPTEQIAQQLVKNQAVMIPEEAPHLLRKIAESCVGANFANIFRFLDGLQAFEPYGGEIFDKEFVLLAVEKSIVELVRLSLSHFELHHDLLEANVQASILDKAVQRGDYSIVDLLITEKGLQRIVEEPSEETSRLLHTCVAVTGDMSEAEIEQKIDIAGLLLGINRKLLEERDRLERTPLLTYFPHVRLLTELIRSEANVLARDKDNMTVIHLAEERSHFSSQDYHQLLRSIIPEWKMKQLVRANLEFGPVKWLFHRLDPVEHSLEILKEAGDDFNCLVEDGYSLLAYAIKMGRSVGTLRKLLQCGADVGWRREGTGESLLHLVAQFGRSEAVSLFVEEYGMDVNVTDGMGHTPITYAIQSDLNEGGRYETGMILTEKRCRFEEVAGTDGQSMLHTAAKTGNLESVRLLLHLGVNVNAPDFQGNTALHLGTEEVGEDKDYFSITNILMEKGADVNALNKLGESPYETALQNEKLDFETFQLLKYKSDARRVRACSTPTLISILRMSEAMENAEFTPLFQECLDHGADFGIQDEQGNSLLHLAAQGRRFRAVHALISANKVDDINLRNWKQETALHNAAQGGDKEVRLKIIKFLIETGRADVNAKDWQNFTFLHHYMSSWLFASSLVYPIIDYLIELGCSHLFEDVGGLQKATPIQLAVYTRVTDRLHRVVNKSELPSELQRRYNMDWRSLNGQRRSLLHISAQQSYSSHLGCFLDFGELDVNGADEDGDTPLHSAIQGEDSGELLEKCKLLIEKGADVNIRNKQGLTPWAMAAERYSGSDKEELLGLLGGKS